MILMLVPVALHDPKGHVVSPFYVLELSNELVPLMTLLASCDTDTSINGIK